MTKIRTCRVLFLSGTLILGGCSANKPLDRSPVTVVITSSDGRCSAFPPTQNVYEGGQVSFKGAGQQYDIVFKSPKYPIAAPVQSDQPQPYSAHGDGWCTTIGIHCDYKYTIKKNNVSCADPVIHITPN